MIYTVISVAAPPAAFGVITLALPVLDVLVLMRIYKMCKAAGSGNVATLKSLDSIGWAIVALIFAGLIPGIMLILAHHFYRKALERPDARSRRFRWPADVRIWARP